MEFSGKWRACGWSVTQLDHEGDMGPMRGLYVTMEVKNEVQRTRKRGELAPFLYLVESICVPEEKSGVSAQKRKTRTCGSKAGVRFMEFTEGVLCSR